MMSVLNEFIEFLETELKNGSVYVLGAQGQRYPFSDDWLEQREHNNQSNIRRVKATIEKRRLDYADSRYACGVVYRTKESFPATYILYMAGFYTNPLVLAHICVSCQL